MMNMGVVGSEHVSQAAANVLYQLPTRYITTHDFRPGRNQATIRLASRRLRSNNWGQNSPWPVLHPALAGPNVIRPASRTRSPLGTDENTRVLVRLPSGACPPCRLLLIWHRWGSTHCRDSISATSVCLLGAPE